jgi:hypothetical protein
MVAMIDELSRWKPGNGATKQFANFPSLGATLVVLGGHLAGTKLIKHMILTARFIVPSCRAPSTAIRTVLVGQLSGICQIMNLQWLVRSAMLFVLRCLPIDILAK